MTARNGGSFVYAGVKYEYSRVATATYQWGLLPLDAVGGIQSTPQPLWFASRKSASGFGRAARKQWYNFGYAIARAWQ